MLTLEMCFGRRLQLEQQELKYVEATLQVYFLNADAECILNIDYLLEAKMAVYVYYQFNIQTK